MIKDMGGKRLTVVLSEVNNYADPWTYSINRSTTPLNMNNQIMSRKTEDTVK